MNVERRKTSSFNDTADRNPASGGSIGSLVATQIAHRKYMKNQAIGFSDC
jgi:hypothetical protein